MGLRVFVGRRQAVVSTNDVKADVAQLAERAVAMARVAPEDPFAGLADPAQLARDIPDLDLLDPDLPTVARPGRARQARRGGRARGQGRHQVGRRVGVRRHRRHGAGDERRLSRRLSQFRPERVDDRDRGRRHRDGARLRLFLRAARRRSRCRPRRSGASAGERTVERLNPRKVETKRVPVVFDRRVAGSLVGHLAERDQRRRGRAQDELPQGQARRAAVQARHQRARRSAAQARPALAPVRRRGRRDRAPRRDRGRRAHVLVSRLRDRARARACDHRARPARGVVGAVAGTEQPASLGRHAPRRTH